MQIIPISRAHVYRRCDLTDRTVTHVADSGTLCTLSSSGEAGPEGSPFGSHVDYVLDEQVISA